MRCVEWVALFKYTACIFSQYVSADNISAINRGKYIIEKYPNTPSVPAALHLMAHNYDVISANTLAKDARRVLKKSYPLYTPHYSLEN